MEFPTTESQEREGWSARRKWSPRFATRSRRRRWRRRQRRRSSGVEWSGYSTNGTEDDGQVPQVSGREDEDADAHILSFEMAWTVNSAPPVQATDPMKMATFIPTL